MTKVTHRDAEKALDVLYMPAAASYQGRADKVTDSWAIMKKYIDQQKEKDDDRD